MTTAETHSSGEYEALLRTDFASFAQHAFHELNPCTPFCARLASRGHCSKAGGGPHRPRQAADHQ
jgi:hypothetical protein